MGDGGKRVLFPVGLALVSEGQRTVGGWWGDAAPSRRGSTAARGCSQGSYAERDTPAGASTLRRTPG